MPPEGRLDVVLLLKMLQNSTSSIDSGQRLKHRIIAPYSFFPVHGQDFKYYMLIM